MSRPPVSLLLLPCVPVVAPASARAQAAMSEAPPAIAWYALLIVVFALLVVVGLLASRREDHDELPEIQPETPRQPRAPRKAGNTKEPTR
ncbi:hypothetical protein [uncultured Methylibium sp.]|uniref:hypothetical protein n=1 Tax=uncultured Methylibium sp. TaxID=381093 RepID=UPI0025DA8F87|nr:hypothetical protein [uncultured Methylibium sp.]